MSKVKLKYELIDNQNGRTLCSGTSADQVLANAAQYIQDYNVDYNDVSYIIIRNGAKAVIIHQSTGSELRHLIDDLELDPYTEEWEDGSNAEYLSQDYDEYSDDGFF